MSKINASCATNDKVPQIPTKLIPNPPPKALSSMSQRSSPNAILGKSKKNSDEFSGLNIFNIGTKSPNFTSANVDFQGKIYDHVYKEDKLFEETLKYHRELKTFDTPKTPNLRFADNGKFFKIRRADFRRLRLENLHKRSQTAGFDRRIIVTKEKVTKKTQKEPKHIRRELIPQTKACCGNKSPSPLSNLSIQGIIKDFAVRKTFHFAYNH
ncbi:hypothetical protein SteCoe_37368 [Stentor coeruleus]|uniref:Uncharacterized protein n=1 Tax=Stentor coeruleus TaxID=5963 RepID=A0A1R2AN53_9CILI|nr:hypothetical protein SteCoe_37368 [Stentor coeruleus]